MAYKDEYEVARLYASPEFRAGLEAQFEDWRALEFHLAPPLLPTRDPASGRAMKRRFGPWMLAAFGVLARFKKLRGTPFDIFARSAERRTERQLVAEYFALIDEISAGLRPDNHAIAVDLAALPETIRGYGHVKDAHIARAKLRREELLRQFRTPATIAAVAE
jgi:indolepyruvate ferredoxin oxidoreductase